MSVLKSAGDSAFHKFLDDAAVATPAHWRVQPLKDVMGNPASGVTTIEYMWQVEPDTPPE